MKPKSVTIDGERYFTSANSSVGEVVEIQEVHVIYGDGFKWLKLGFDLPETKFNVGDKVRLVIEKTA